MRRGSGATALALAIGLALAAAAQGALAAEGKRVESVIAPADIQHERGFCYTATVRAPVKPDTMAGQASALRLFEDGQELGPAHALHETIRVDGAGAYCHWSGSLDGEPQMLYFSASDNSDPRANGRTYRWAVIYDAAGAPVPPEVGLLEGQACRLVAMPDAALKRDRHTTLLAGFDAPDRSDAEYARVEPREIGMGSIADAPGRFGGGVAVQGPEGSVMYPGLDNYNPRRGTVEFWAQARGQPALWADDKEHWLLVLYPERAGAAGRDGMTPQFVTLRKTPAGDLELRVSAEGAPGWAPAVNLRKVPGWTLRLPAAGLDAAAWHHILVSWDLSGRGRLWLLADGAGVTAEMGLLSKHPAPNPGGFIVFGGFWGLPGDNVATSDCNLDDLRIGDGTVAGRLAGAEARPDTGVDEARLMAEEDAARAVLDQLLRLQFHGGWAADYNYPTYTPGGWDLVGRGVDLWFQNTAWAGQALLRGWLIWGDDRYLDAAIETADMLCRTQLDNGSWAYHYTYTRGEFRPWGQSAYIAQAMQSNQIRFLCLMSRLLGYERYDRAVRKAGDWMVSIQFPSGAWGWEAYPADKKGPYGHPALNDAVTPQAMSDLFVIWCATGEARYLAPVPKGADWIAAAQLGPPTYGWADQYDEANSPVWMRNFEPPATSMQAISAAAMGLTLAYDLTGDDKYVAPLRKVLGWLDAVPEAQRGWLWYDPEKGEPVVAYNNEMLPVTHPKAVAEYIPRLDAHYGTKFPWQADRIRVDLKWRESGPVYPDWRGLRPRKDFAQAPAAADMAGAFRGDGYRGAREQIAAWAAGRPQPGMVGGTPSYGRTFVILNALVWCEQLLSDIEYGRAGLGDIPAAAIPRYARTGPYDWTYMEPGRDYYATPLAATGR